jgi:hypothetical protein
MKNAKVIRRPFPGVTVLNHPVRRKRNVLAGSDQHDNPRALPAAIPIRPLECGLF